MSEKLNSRVLMLNASYEVLGTVDVARAISLTFRSKDPVVVVQEVEGRFLHDGRGNSYPVPSVIMLSKNIYVKRKKAPKGARRQRIYERDFFTCQYCVKVFESRNLTLDHIIPKSKGGSGKPENLVTACKKCNQRKADRTPEEARMPLYTPLHELKLGDDKILYCHYAESRPEWTKYLEYDPVIKKALERRRERKALLMAA